MSGNPLLKAQFGVTVFAFTALLVSAVIFMGAPTFTPGLVMTGIFAWLAVFFGGMVVMFKY